MEDMRQVAQDAINFMPPTSRFTTEDAAVVGRHRTMLLAWEDELVQRFYDALFAHGPTRMIFHEGERQEREKTLHHWWQRTVHGPLDDEYFSWMAMVGLVHVVRQVQNPMMLAMTSLVADFVKEKAGQVKELGASDALAVTVAFQRLTLTVGAVITYGYDHARAAALYNVIGMESALLDRLTHNEASEMLVKVRGH